MIVKTVPQLYGKSMAIWDGSEIKFDHTGSCTVTNDLGKKLIEKYPSFVFPENFEKVKPVTVTEEINQALVQRLNGEIYDLKTQIKEITDAKLSVEADLKEWKDSISVHIEKAATLETQLAKEKESSISQTQYLELKISLMNSTVEQLKQLCKESGFDEKDWSKMTGEKLIEYILSK